MNEITNGQPRQSGAGLPTSRPNTARDARRRFVSMPAGVTTIVPAVVGRVGAELPPGERRQSSRACLLSDPLGLPHDQMDDFTGY